MVPAGQLRTVLGVRTVNYLTQNTPLAIVDSSLAQS